MTPRKPGSLSRSPFRTLLGGYSPRSLVEDMFGQFLAESGNGEMTEIMNAAMDVVETDLAFEIKMDLPGVNASEVDIQIDNSMLTVRGQRNEGKEEKDEGKQYHRIERYSGTFSRSVALPSAINEDEVAAEYSDGVLKIVVPKAENAKPRKITIKS